MQPRRHSDPSRVLASHSRPYESASSDAASSITLNSSSRDARRGAPATPPSPTSSAHSDPRVEAAAPLISKPSTPWKSLDWGAAGSYHGAWSDTGSVYGSCPRLASRSGQVHPAVMPVFAYAATRFEFAISVPPSVNQPYMTIGVSLRSEEHTSELQSRGHLV